MTLNKKVLLYGGSYNPMHLGHKNAATNVANFLCIDEIWLIPRKYNYNHELLLDFNYRKDMIELTTKDDNRFKICDIEILDTEDKLIYTIDTLKALKEKYDYDFYFLIGADQLNSFETWKDYKELINYAHFVCYHRPGYPLNKEIVSKYKFILVSGEKIEASSTSVREGNYSIVTNEVKDYIINNHLYLKEKIKSKLPEDRYNHVVSTANLAKRIAKTCEIDENKAYIAAILHDISKGLSKEENAEIVAKHFPDKLSYPKYTYHAFASSFIANTQYHVDDEEILNAIKQHARATKNMNTLDKIIYSADKLEESRKFAYVYGDIRKIAFVDMDKCFIETMKSQVKYFVENNLPIDENINEMINYYEEQLNGR